MSGTNGSYIANDAVVAELEKVSGECTTTAGAPATEDVVEPYLRVQGSQCEHDFITAQLASVKASIVEVRDAIYNTVAPTPVDYTQLLTAIKSSVASIDTDTDKLTDLLAAVDGLEALVTTSNVNTAATVAALGTILTQVQAINSNTDTLEAVLVNAVTQLQAINANTDQIEPKLDSIIALLTPSAKPLKTGGANIAAGAFARADAYGTVASPPAVSGALQSYTVTVVKSSGAPLAGNAVRVITDQGTFYLVEGMSQSFSVAQDSQNKAERLATAMNVTALGNSAAVVTWTYE